MILKVTPLIFSLAGCAMVMEPQAEGTAYVSVAYGFAFTAPAPLTIEEYAPESLSVGLLGQENGFHSVADIRLYTAGEGAGYDSFDVFAIESLSNMCAADGPRGTVTCQRVQQRQPFTTRAGLTGEVLYLERIHEIFATNEKEVDGFGPIFLFNLSGVIAGAEFFALAVQPPVDRRAAEIDGALLRQVASSLTSGPGYRPD